MRVRQSLIRLSIFVQKIRNERDVIRKILSYLSRFTPMIKFYSRVIALCIGTAFFGLFLIINDKNVVERVVLFPQGFSITFGYLMIIVSVVKMLAVFKPRLKIKKYALIAITLCWLTIGWAYVING